MHHTRWREQVEGTRVGGKGGFSVGRLVRHRVVSLASPADTGPHDLETWFQQYLWLPSFSGLDWTVQGTKVRRRYNVASCW